MEELDFLSENIEKDLKKIAEWYAVPYKGIPDNIVLAFEKFMMETHVLLKYETRLNKIFGIVLMRGTLLLNLAGLKLKGASSFSEEEFSCINEMLETFKYYQDVEKEEGKDL